MKNIKQDTTALPKVNPKPSKKKKKDKKNKNDVQISELKPIPKLEEKNNQTSKIEPIKEPKEELTKTKITLPEYENIQETKENTKNIEKSNKPQNLEETEIYRIFDDDFKMSKKKKK